jgi:hypothetical protein
MLSFRLPALQGRMADQAVPDYSLEGLGRCRGNGCVADAGAIVSIVGIQWEAPMAETKKPRKSFRHG